MFYYNNLKGKLNASCVNLIHEDSIESQSWITVNYYIRKLCKYLHVDYIDFVQRFFRKLTSK